MANLDDVFKKEFWMFTESELLEYLEDYDDEAADRIIDGLEQEGLIIPDEPEDAFEGFVQSLTSFGKRRPHSLFTLNVLQGDKVLVHVDKKEIRFTSANETALLELCDVMFRNGYYNYTHQATLFNSRPMYSYSFKLEQPEY
jgi:hypothetical protein